MIGVSLAGDAVGNCSRALGVENGGIHYSQMYASTEYHSSFPVFGNSKWTASIARLHNTDLVNAWIPKYNGRNQWLEVSIVNLFFNIYSCTVSVKFIAWEVVPKSRLQTTPFDDERGGSPVDLHW